MALLSFLDVYGAIALPSLFDAYGAIALPSLFDAYGAVALSMVLSPWLSMKQLLFSPFPRVNSNLKFLAASSLPMW